MAAVAKERAASVIGIRAASAGNAGTNGGDKRAGGKKSVSGNLYGSKWQAARIGFLKKHPLCVRHSDRGLTVAAVVVDHKVPHRGNMKLFCDKNNWQSLCKHCHDSHKQRLERSGVVVGCGLNGMPLDDKHHWAGAKRGGEG